MSEPTTTAAVDGPCRWWRGGHAWSRWEVVKVNLRERGSVIDMQDRQRRSCLRCGLAEERMLSRGLLDNGSDGG